MWNWWKKKKCVFRIWSESMEMIRHVFSPLYRHRISSLLAYVTAMWFLFFFLFFGWSCQTQLDHAAVEHIISSWLNKEKVILVLQFQEKYNKSSSVKLSNPSSILVDVCRIGWMWNHVCMSKKQSIMGMTQQTDLHAILNVYKTAYQYYDFI